nr:S-layer protein [uncultured Methanoregula sp.]
MDRALRIPARYHNNQILAVLILTGIAIACIFVSPAYAGDQYMAGSPVLSASLSGTNEFAPGQDVKLPVVVKNTGLNEFKISKSSIVDRDDLANTAKFLTVTLEPGNSPFIIKSDPQVLGDLKASSTATGTFTVRIPSDTPAGTYAIPVVLNYTYMYDAYQYGVDTIEYSYKTKTETQTIPINVKPDVRTKVISTDVQSMNAGTEGYIRLLVKNIGHENATKAIVTIVRNDQSPVIPTEGRVYVGDFVSGGTVNCTFKATVDKAAEAQTYPLDLVVKYEDHNGDTVSSNIETIGIPVGKKIEFLAVADPEPIAPGQKKVITVRYTNTGGATAYEAQARVSMVDPFTSNDDSAYLGDIAPGVTKTASFLVTADKTASIKEYGIDSEVKYRDALDNSVTSDPIKVTVNVSEGKSIVSQLLGSPLLIGLVAIIVVAIGYLIYRKKRLQ